MTLLEAIILGVVQGLFMFIPVSSSSHLALTQQYLIDRGSSLPPPSSPELILFDLVVHVGTMVSVAIIFRKDLARLAKGLLRDISSLRTHGTHTDTPLPYAKLTGLSILSLMATGIIGGIILATNATEVFDRPNLIALNLIITGLLLFWTDGVTKNNLGPLQFSKKIAIIIGIAQGFALLPGLSRSGLTIAIALYIGVKRHWAATYSFFLAIPTILGATLVQFALVYRDTDALTINSGAFIAGFVAAAVVGTVSLAGVLWLLYRAKFKIFSFYVWLLALVVLSGSVV